jgi:DNA-directed RNA polymerase subunit RPC12/RpoP
MEAKKMYQCLTCSKKFKPYKDDDEFYNWVIHRKCGNWAAKVGSVKEIKPGEPIADIIQATRAYVEKIQSMPFE